MMVADDEITIIGRFSGLVLAGAYGKVTKVRVRRGNREEIAILKECTETVREDLDSSIIRETTIGKYLKDYPNKNIAHLICDLDPFENGTGSLLFQYGGDSLESLMRDRGQIPPQHYPSIPSIIEQLLSGLCYLHKHDIIHRDIKPANLCYNRDTKILKIVDFGISKMIDNPYEPRTPGMVTLWYRAPEMFGNPNKPTYEGANVLYGKPVDVWSVGCVMGEMMMLVGAPHRDRVRALYEPHPPPTGLQNKTSHERELVLEPVMRTMIKARAREVRIEPTDPRTLKEIAHRSNPRFESLLVGMLTIDPDKRMTAETAHQEALNAQPTQVAYPTPCGHPALPVPQSASRMPQSASRGHPASKRGKYTDRRNQTTIFLN